MWCSASWSWPAPWARLGLNWAPLGVAAAIGVVLYVAGAGPAAGLLILALASPVLLLTR